MIIQVIFPKGLGQGGREATEANVIRFGSKHALAGISFISP